MLPRKRLDQLPYPEIAEAASFFQTTTMTAQDLIARAGQVAERLNELLSPETVGAFQKALANLESATGAIARNEGNIDKMLVGLPKATGDLRALAAKMDQLVGSASLVIAELGP